MIRPTLVAAALLLAPGPAQACLTASSHLALIHSALPAPLPEGAIVAEVEIGAGDAPLHLAAEGPLYSTGLSARVRRMIQGDYSGDTLILRPAHMTSCDNPFDNGRVGYVVGTVRGYEDGVLVLDPVTVRSGSGFRLPDGFRLSEPRR